MAQWLEYCATSHNVVGSIHTCVWGMFPQVINSIFVCNQQLQLCVT